jgi:non-heme chloroperoxidase
LDRPFLFYGYNRPGAKVSEGVRESFWMQGMLAGFPASYFCIKAFSETDQTEDLKEIDVPTLILHGHDDQIVPIQASALQSVKLIKGAELKIYKGAPHGMCTTRKEEVNADLLSFFKTKVSAPGKRAAQVAGAISSVSQRLFSSKPLCAPRSDRPQFFDAAP